MSKLSENDSIRHTVELHKASVDARLRKMTVGKKPSTVYDPLVYAITAGGKRLRAILVLLACESVGGKTTTALDAACAIELLHNFTLIHDDIMDKSDLRRGIPTVHKKWNVDEAILSGDQMAASAYEMLLKTKSPRLPEIMRIFTGAFVDVCEGQGYDIEYEQRNDLGVKDYRFMIRKKTAKMISAAGEIGAFIGGGSKEEVKALRLYGAYLGIAFQLKDDILDIDGNQETFGKLIGRDIIEGKRTYLLLMANERAKGKDRTIIRAVMRHEIHDNDCIKRVRDIYEAEGVLADARKEMERTTRKAQAQLSKLPRNRARAALLWLSDKLLERQT